MSKFQLSLKQTGLLVTGIGLGAITVLAGLMPDDGSQERVSIASITVEEIINKVEINSAGHAISAGDRDFVEAYIGLRLQAGDGVRTFQDSEARVDISIDDTVRFMRTTPNTLWRVGKFVANDGAVIELDGGRILVFDEETPDGRPPLQIITPAGTATARGTWMSIEVNPESGETVVQCFRGSCELANDQGVQLLSDQQKGSFTELTAPTLPTFMTHEDEETFYNIPEASNGTVPIPESTDTFANLIPMPRNVVSKTVAAVSDDDDSNEEPIQITEIELVSLVLASDRSNNNSDKAVAPAGNSKNRSSDKANSGLNSGPANVTHTKAKGNANDDSPDWSAAKTHGIGLLFKGLGIASGNSEESTRPIGRFAVKNPNAGVDNIIPAQSNKAGNAGDVVNPAFLAKNSSNPHSTKDTTFDASLNGHPRGNNLDFNVPNGKQLTAKAGNQNHDGNVSGTGNSLARNSKASEADSPSKTGNSNKNASVSPQSEGSNLNSKRGGRSNASDNKASTGSAPADKGNSSSGGEPKASVDSAPADQGNSSSAGEPKASVDSAPADKGNSSSAGEPKASVDSAPADKGNSSSAGEPKASVDSAPADKGNSSSAGSAAADPTPANDGNGNGGSTQNGNAPANEGNVDLVKKAGNTGNGKNG